MSGALHHRYGRAVQRGMPACPRPFSGKNYNKNVDQLGGEHTWPCGLCGKPVKPEEGSRWATVIAGGARFQLEGETGPDTDEADAGHMGNHAIGSDCARKLRKCGVRLVKMTPP